MNLVIPETRAGDIAISAPAGFLLRMARCVHAQVLSRLIVDRDFEEDRALRDCATVSSKLGQKPIL